MLNIMTHYDSEPAAISREGDFADRFWYWHGASGKRYIHSVYKATSCPPLPGAVFVAVRRTGDLREAVAVGRFSRIWDVAAGITGGLDLQALDADELHVHLLAREDEAAEAVADDLTIWLYDRLGPKTRVAA